VVYPAELPDQILYFWRNGGQRLAAQHDVPLLGQLPLAKALVRTATRASPPCSTPESVVIVCRFLAALEAVAPGIRNTWPQTAVVQMNLNASWKAQPAPVFDIR
jgi:ATP-binding protein involved in chromosome partitioning